MENQLIELIATIHWNRDKHDEWSWVGEHLTTYTIQSGYRAMKQVKGITKSECLG